MSSSSRARLLIATAMLAASTVVLAEDAQLGAPEAGKAATEADYEMLRKLLGVTAPPTRPAPAKAEPEIVPAALVEPAATIEPAVLREPLQDAPPVRAAKPAKRFEAPVVRARPRPAPMVTSDEPLLEEAKLRRVPPEVIPPAPLVPDVVPAPSFLSPDVPPPGSVIQTSNLERWKDFLSPSIQWVVRRGAKLNVVANQPLPMEPEREAATQRYHSQVTLSKDKTHMLNYVAGVPFPFVQTDDPDAGIKMILNWDGRITADDLDIRNFSCDTGNIETSAPLQVERDYLFEHFRRLYYVSRLHHDPKPTWENAEGVRYREMLFPVREPFDLKGAGFTYNRFQNAGRQDDSWLYLPQTKRVRRLSTAQRSEGTFGQDIDLDSYGGYGGNPAWTQWRLLGTKTILATMHGRTMPAKWLPAPNDFLFDDGWEPRDVWVLEGRSRLPGYAFGSRVIYVDRESFIIPYTEIFDLKGKLWKGLVQNWQFKRKMRSDSKYTWASDRVVIAGLSLFDMQLGHATRCEYPARELAATEDGWYLNVGDAEGTTESVFDVATFIQQGR